MWLVRSALKASKKPVEKGGIMSVEVRTREGSRIAARVRGNEEMTREAGNSNLINRIVHRNGSSQGRHREGSGQLNKERVRVPPEPSPTGKHKVSNAVLKTDLILQQGNDLPRETTANSSDLHKAVETRVDLLVSGHPRQMKKIDFTQKCQVEPGVLFSG